MGVIDRIKGVMTKKNITRADLVKLTDMKKSTIYRLFEEDVKEEKILLETLRPISRALGVSLDYLLNGIDGTIDDLSDEAKMIARKYENITPRQKAFIQSAFDSWDDEE